MSLKTQRTISLLLAIIGMASLAGCDLINPPKGPPPSMSKEAIATREAPPELVFRGELAGKPVYLLVHNCEVFQVDPQADGGVKWTSVQEPDFYPLWTSCIRESMEVKDGVVTVKLGRQAFAAGGCCAAGGVYRTRDGTNWKKIEQW